VRIDSYVLLEGGKKSRQRDADGVEAWRDLLTAENALRVGKKIDGRQSASRLRNQLHGSAHLWDAQGVVHYSGNFPGSGP